MSGHLSGAKHSHHQADRAERARLEQLLKADGDPELQQTPQWQGANRPRPEGNQVRPQHGPGEERQDDEHEPSAHERR